LSSEATGTSTIAGFWTITRVAERLLTPLVFLHGSNQDEFSLLDFASDIASTYPQYFPRGHEPGEAAFTFFRRHPDRSIDEANLTANAWDVSALLADVGRRHGRSPLLIGFSSGAIMAAAILAKHPEATAGAVLLRPERPFGDTPFPHLTDTPVLIISGRDDPRRKRTDAEQLFTQLRTSGAAVAWHDLPCGHGLDPEAGDTKLTRAWLAKRGS
jgi:phospholipase/carboxylesterase